MKYLMEIIVCFFAGMGAGLGTGFAGMSAAAAQQFAALLAASPDWARVNAFCEDGRIAGKPFGKMETEELKQVLVKLHAIQRKGGLRKMMEENRTVTVVMGSIGEA